MRFTVPSILGHPSGAAAIFKACDQADAEAAEHQRVLEENAELRCRVDELTAENAELRERAEEWDWERKDDEPMVVQRG